jgi:hypothetical protein
MPAEQAAGAGRTGTAANGPPGRRSTLFSGENVGSRLPMARLVICSLVR